MITLSRCILLFVLNWLDAQLTILWVRLDVASEGNGIMARVLSLGEGHFLGLKIFVGAFAAYILYRCAHRRLARQGMTLVLGVYMAVMLVHVATGFFALGWQAPTTVISYFAGLPGAWLGILS